MQHDVYGDERDEKQGMSNSKIPGNKAAKRFERLVDADENEMCVPRVIASL